jgi:dolichol-phosphate mannosyltransferase
MNMQQKKISIVIPVLNESSSIHPLLDALDGCLPAGGYGLELVFVDDGSVDGTLEVLQQATFRGKAVGYLSFSRNFGHQNALKAGLDAASGDCVISMDGDLQHPPALIPALLEKWEQGYDIVYTRRRDSRKQGWVKRYTSGRFYRLMGFLSGLQMEQGTADFRLVSRQVADMLGVFREHDLFLRGIIKWMGFSQYAIDYEPERRFSGTTKYNGKKMVGLAIQGITSFSIKPLYVSILLGLLFFVLSLAYIPYVVWCVFAGRAVAGWASTIIAIMFFGGLQMLLLGIIGIYIGKIFIQSKQRPVYIIRETNMGEIKCTG